MLETAINKGTLQENKLIAYYYTSLISRSPHTPTSTTKPFLFDSITLQQFLHGDCKKTVINTYCEIIQVLCARLSKNKEHICKYNHWTD
jgi:hypothetical protein